MVEAINDDGALRNGMGYHPGDPGAHELAPCLDWSRMSGSDHFVQFYETDRYLIDALSGFIRAGLDVGEGCIVVANRAHREGAEDKLMAEGLNLGEAIARGQYVSLDPAETLSKFTLEGLPSAGHFNEVIGGVITRVGEGRSRVRVYGDMVALLCGQGNHEAALRLEELWNDLRRTHSFSLFCAYPMNGFGDETLTGSLNDICAAHTHVIPTESYTALSNADDRLRQIALLQQKAESLRAEIEERKQAQEALRRREAELTDFVENATLGLHWVGPDGTIQWANRSEMELLGYTSEEYIGRHIAEFHADQDVINDILDRLGRGEELKDFEARLRAKDGSIRHVLINSNVLWENGKFVHTRCFTRDITERKLAEDNLLQVKDELEVQVEDLRRLHVMSVDLTRSLNIEAVLNEVLRAAMDVQGTDMGLLSLASTEHDGLNIKVSSGFDESFLRDVECIPAGVGACGVCYKERRRVVVEDIYTDPQFKQYRDAARMGGFRACHSTPLITRGGNIIGVLSVYFREPHRPSERETRLMDLYAQMAADSIENARLHQRVQRELEERERLLVSEQMARSEAEGANRLKDEFLATVSHELRTPLTAIMGWTHMIRCGMLDEATLDKAVRTIERNAKSQAQLVEDILDVSRVITGKLRLKIGLVDVASVINAAIDSVQLAAESKGIQLEVRLDPSVRRVSGDAGRLQQVVWNLLSNAIKFTPAGGRVVVRLERAGTNVQIKVSDSGEGIEPDFLPFIFDRFRQADGTSTRKHGGLGLGLAIVRHLVELHGGTVRAESAGVDHGTTFIVSLPLAQGRERVRNKERNSQSFWTGEKEDREKGSRPSLEGIHVLMVDDDEDTLQMLSVMLTEYKAHVQTAASASKALELLQWYKPDVMVFDLAMPSEDGFSLIGKVRALESENALQTPVIALTAYVRVEDRTQALAAGFNMFVPKPVEPDELVTVIANLAESGKA